MHSVKPVIDYSRTVHPASSGSLAVADGLCSAPVGGSLLGLIAGAALLVHSHVQPDR